MNPSLLTPPQLDPTPIFEIFRGNFAAELLTAAVAHFRVFDRFAGGPKTADELRRDRLGGASGRGAADGPAPFGLLVEDAPGRLDLSELAREHLTAGGPFDVSDYVRMAADSPGVLTMVERLRSNRPAGSEPEEAGAAYIYREGMASAMEQEEAARRLTLALAGRATTSPPCWRARRWDRADPAGRGRRNRSLQHRFSPEEPRLARSSGTGRRCSR